MNQRKHQRRGTRNNPRIYLMTCKYCGSEFMAANIRALFCPDTTGSCCNELYVYHGMSLRDRSRRPCKPRSIGEVAYAGEKLGPEHLPEFYIDLRSPKKREAWAAMSFSARRKLIHA